MRLESRPPIVGVLTPLFFLPLDQILIDSEPNSPLKALFGRLESKKSEKGDKDTRIEVQGLRREFSIDSWMNWPEKKE